MNKTIFRKNIPAVAGGRLRFGITARESSWAHSYVALYLQLRVISATVCESPATENGRSTGRSSAVEIVCTRKVKDNKELEPLRVRAMHKQSRELESVT